MCEEWKRDFSAFFSHMGAKPSPGLTLDRIDNNKDYEPGNCRWATRAEQSRNRRTNIRVVHHGREMLVSDVATLLGVSRGAIHHRMQEYGCSAQEAIDQIESTRSRAPR